MKATLYLPNLITTVGLTGGAPPRLPKAQGASGCTTYTQVVAEFPRWNSFSLFLLSLGDLCLRNPNLRHAVPNLAFTLIDVEQATVVMDKMTQKSKGYGFVTFKGMDGAHAALENPEKMIDVRPDATCPRSRVVQNIAKAKTFTCRRVQCAVVSSWWRMSQPNKGFLCPSTKPINIG